MGKNVKHLILTAGFGLLTVAVFAGCATGDRSTGQYIDDRMTARRVKSELKNNSIYKFENVNVNTYRGVVQLNGWITQPEQKQVAEQIAKNVPGVLDVVNNLSLKPQFTLAPGGQTSAGRPASETIERTGEATQEPQPQQPRTQEQLRREQLQREQQQP